MRDKEQLVSNKAESGGLRGRTGANMAAGWLSTHILDTSRGVPAAGVKIMLYRVTGNNHKKIAEVVTNAEGRTDAPLLAGKDFRVGGYELVFCVGAYLRGAGQVTGETLFLDEIPIRFGVSDEAAHYHVPLLLQAFGYSTYRGS